ncbi:MAG: DDE-type integrase/transposase/recombinase [Gammaproteobacteria bacterium]|nr:DDE-type integrase/transposase/recombinase [Gammaproteobacteria bacterium]MDE0280783.1 DDE-type integrase/transposase/recombinase [Gammaproteobacteria bacterium]
MSRKNPPEPNEIALFRYRVIATLLPAPRGQVASKARELSERAWDIPGSDRTRVASETIRSWLLNYRTGGFDALVPKGRSDRHGQRRLSPETVESLAGLKRDKPHLSVRGLVKEAHDRGLVPKSVHLPRSTVARMLKSLGLMGPPPGDGGGSGDPRRFAYEQAGEMWQSDVLHGPRVRDHRGHARKAYLIAFLDDATRVVPHAAFAFSETVAAFLPVFRLAVEKRGLARRLYVDNGANYRSRALELICARLGIALIHAKPYSPAGKGKIERWLRTVRQQFLPTLDKADLGSLDAINGKLHAWIEGEYHRNPHQGLGGRTPLDQWALCSAEVRYAGPGMDLDELFLLEKRRKVRKDRTVHFRTRVYEVDAWLIGEFVILRYDPAAPPTRPLAVFHQDKPAGIATLIDIHANARIRRRPASDGLSFRNAGSGPDHPESSEPSEPSEKPDPEK